MKPEHAFPLLNLVSLFASSHLDTLIWSSSLLLDPQVIVVQNFCLKFCISFWYRVYILHLSSHLPWFDHSSNTVPYLNGSNHYSLHIHLHMPDTEPMDQLVPTAFGKVGRSLWVIDGACWHFIMMRTYLLNTFPFLLLLLLLTLQCTVGFSLLSDFLPFLPFLTKISPPLYSHYLCIFFDVLNPSFHLLPGGFHTFPISDVMRSERSSL